MTPHTPWPKGLLDHYPSLEVHRPALSRILEQSGTPIFVCERNNLINRLETLQHSLAENWGPHVIGYSFKTNYLVAQSRILQEQGAWAEVVSHREYQLALELGYPETSIIYNGPFKNDASLQSALVNRSLVNMNDHDELDRVMAFVRDREVRYEIGIRVSSTLPKLGHSRFGFSLENEEAQTAVDKIRGCTGLELVALHTHLYGDTDDPSLYAVAATRLAQFAQEFLPDYQHRLKFLDIGGGFPAHSPQPKSRQTWDPQPIDVYIRSIAKSLRSYFPEELHRPTLIVEPGRYLTCDGIVLVTRVVHVKERGGQQMITCDGSLSMLPLTHYCPQIIRLYGRDLLPRRWAEKPTVIQGATCRENDMLYDGPFAEAQVGDYLIHFAAGAYNSSLSPDFIFASPGMELL